MRRPTSTATFGSSRRESHDASAFYGRFVAPEISGDESVVACSTTDVIYAHDARDMAMVEASSIALVVTSPPYFAGKEYEANLGVNGVPGSYLEYLQLLTDVFAECKRVLEPGGRIAVNVANLGRRPFRSLAGDVTEILQGLGLLLRGEVVWWKGRAAGGSCAWGSFQRPANPVLRDVTERVVIAGKGRFDRAVKPEERDASGLPSVATISREEFMEATTDLWELPPESARRVGHPAPFPVELPTRLINLYTYEGDVVLDPFMGSGSTAIAAVRTGRHYVGFDTDEQYVQRAKERVEAERADLRREVTGDPAPSRVRLPAVARAGPAENAAARAIREGVKAIEIVEVLLGRCGFVDIRRAVTFPKAGVEVDFCATDADGREWAFDVSGAFTLSRPGLQRADTLWRSLGKAAVIHAHRPDLPIVLVTTDVPRKGSAGAKALAAMRGPGRPVFDVVAMLDPDDQARLGGYAQGDGHVRCAPPVTRSGRARRARAATPPGPARSGPDRLW